LSTFTVVNDAVLVAAIDRCRKRLAYIAPGISESVADAIGRLFECADPPLVTVIIDSDPEVCRLGYGTVSGLKRLRELVELHQFGIRQQPGLRVAVLASDDDLLIYAPTPRLIEAGSSLDSKPNAIMIGANASMRVLEAAGVEGYADAPLPSESEIGKEPATPEVMDAALADLARVPPKAFDVARVERVFNSKLQYVELEITGYKLSARKVTFPNDLLIGEDAELEKRLRNSFRLLDGGGLSVEIDRFEPSSGEPARSDKGTPGKESYSEARIEADRKKLCDDFLTNIAGFGWLIRRWDRPAFDQRVELLKRKIEAYREGVTQALQESMTSTIKALAIQLLEKMDGKFLPRLSKSLMSAQPREEEKLAVLIAELTKAFGQTDQVFNPEIKVRYKDLTYETIKDDKFKTALEAAYVRSGQTSVFSRLFEEYDAVREVSVAPPPAAGN